MVSRNVTDSSLLPKARGHSGAIVSSPCAACPVRHISVCSALSDQELERLEAVKTHVTLDPGDRLFDEGEEATHIFNVTGGTLKLYKLMPDGRRQVTGFLFPSDFLGLADSETYTCSADAVTGLSLCRFPRKEFASILQTFPNLETRLLGIAQNELKEVQEQIMLLGRKTAMERVASFILLLSSRAKRLGLPDNPVSMQMNQGDIGDYLGLTIETVSRTMSRLKRLNVIGTKAKGRVDILEPETLQEIADGF